MNLILQFIVVFSVCHIVVYSASTNRRTSRVRTEKKVERNPLQTLSLPSNATAIRSDITDSFSCANKAYGYYADVDNDCQIFHVCLPVTFADGHERMYRWSFICPEETSFNQEAFTCVRSDEIPFDCATSERFYDLNRNIGVEDVKDIDSNELPAHRNKPQKQNEKVVAAPPTIPPAPTTLPPTIAPVTTIPTRSSTTIKTSSATTSRPRRPLRPIVPVAANMPTSNTATQSETFSLLDSALKQDNFVKVQRPVVANGPASNIAAQSETYSLLDSALKQDNLVKVQRVDVADVAIVTNPTTTEEDATEVITTDAPTTVAVRTTPEFLYTRIIPELVERGENVITPHVEPILSIFNTQSNSETDELIRNIKQLQNSYLESSTTASPPPEKPSPSVRVALPRRFLFKAESLKNKLGAKH